MNQRDRKTCRCLGNENGNKSTGFKKGQNQKRQANEMQGSRSRACMDRETWNSLDDSDKKAWDGLSDKAKTKIAAHHFDTGKEYASQGSEVNQMEAKEHDLILTIRKTNWRPSNATCCLMTLRRNKKKWSKQRSTNSFKHLMWNLYARCARMRELILT